MAIVIFLGTNYSLSNLVAMCWDLWRGDKWLIKQSILSRSYQHHFLIWIPIHIYLKHFKKRKVYIKKISRSCCRIFNKWFCCCSCKRHRHIKILKIWKCKSLLNYQFNHLENLTWLNDLKTNSISINTNLLTPVEYIFILDICPLS